MNKLVVQNLMSLKKWLHIFKTTHTQFSLWQITQSPFDIFETHRINMFFSKMRPTD